jgi:sporulation protein YlmC with PRC-barrel domain
MVTLVLDSAAVCSDGYRGQVQAVVLDPGAGTVTHLVIEPEGRVGLARLVPMDLVDASAETTQLRCTEAEFQDLEPAEQTLAEFALGQEVPVQLLPPGWRGAGSPTVEGGSILRIPEKETIDLVPAGDVEERRGAHVHATDGDIGQLRALQLDPATSQVTHVLVSERHLLTRKNVAIPFSGVAGLDGDGIRLSLTRQQVRDLPSVNTD